MSAALQAARAVLSPPLPEPVDTVRYTPGDCALLAGPAATLLDALEAVRLAGLRPALLCTDFPDPERLPRGLRALSGELAETRGWMGDFRAATRGQTGALDLAPLSFHTDGHFDWVLDFTGTRPGTRPPGYYSLPTGDFAALKAALLDIAGHRRNGYEKPRYFKLDEGLCAHRRQEIPGCAACLAVCPAGAIASGPDSVCIEPRLCQGCGTCALACPAGAVRHVLPGTGRQLRRLTAALAAWREACGAAAGVWIGAEEAPAGWLPLPVEAPSSLGLEFWLAALAAGASRGAVAPGRLGPASRQTLAAQLAVGRALLEGLGLPPALGLAESAGELAGLPVLPEAAPLPQNPGDDKRRLLFSALDVLLASTEPEATAIDLPAEAPMGRVSIAADRCTLCAACVRICPSQALSMPAAGQVAFTEEGCSLCGLCRNVCPEKALTLTPRLLLSAAARRAPRIVAQADLFACVGCGIPFAPRALIERSRALVADHPMFQGEQARLMSLCPDCRQKAMAGVPA